MTISLFNPFKVSFDIGKKTFRKAGGKRDKHFVLYLNEEHRNTQEIIFIIIFIIIYIICILEDRNTYKLLSFLLILDVLKSLN